MSKASCPTEHLLADPARPDETPSQSKSVIAAINLALHYRFVIVGIPFVVACFVVLMRFVNGPTFVAASKFVPEGAASDVSRLAGLASSFGVTLPRNSDRESLEFYRELILSEDLLRTVATSHYRIVGLGYRDTAGPTLVGLYEVAGRNEQERTTNAITRLRRNINVTPDVKANVITIVVSANNADLAVKINRRILDAINTYNVQTRQSRARAERSFVEARLRAAVSELSSAEVAAKNFLEANRQWQGAPQLMVEQGRLQRRVEMRQQIYSALSQSYEQSRIEEVRNTPVLTILDRPEDSARANNRLLYRLLLALAPALALGLAVSFAHDYFRRMRFADAVEYERFKEMMRSILFRRRGNAAPAKEP